LVRRATAKAKILEEHSNAYRYYVEALERFEEQDDRRAHEWLAALIEDGHECLHKHNGYSYLEECWPDW